MIGPSDAIELTTALTSRVDWEVELAVVVGTRMRCVPERDALDHVLGYTVGNDVSARDIQFSESQWVAKSFDSFCRSDLSSSQPTRSSTRRRCRCGHG